MVTMITEYTLKEFPISKGGGGGECGEREREVAVFTILQSGMSL